ncbi:hypothetical protein NLJ89_g9838 [Agrocybe chaxingu]|uniref:Uncharacterized protein n=1 Tax=Agrocybe chaxingu TaxID=84603 RepID=A0A9W8JZ96_9AGAR|nr:hypothetical protein NLJ89_g9838 [Agrocybe chaxingu]
MKSFAALCAVLTLAIGVISAPVAENALAEVDGSNIDWSGAMRRADPIVEEGRKHRGGIKGKGDSAMVDEGRKHRGGVKEKPVVATVHGGLNGKRDPDSECQGCVVVVQ